MSTQSSPRRLRVAYDAMARASFKEYAERLNWKVAGERMLEAIESVCGDAATHPPAQPS